MTSKIQKSDTYFLSDFLPDGLTEEERRRCAASLGDAQVAIGRGLDWAAHFRALDWPQNTALICDNETWKAAGEAISQSLVGSGFRITLLNIGSEPRPTAELAEYIANHASDSDGLIAVGSGTVNDLTKHAAQLIRKRYIVCGTAPSMNGYLSANAAILAHGHKKSLPSRLPRAALFDLDILDAAPQRLKNAGLGDSICRSTAQFDWLVSHHHLGTAYDELPFKLLAPYEEKLLKGDASSLIQTLLLSGLGMTLAGGSYPASQGEHLLSHYLEMRFPHIAHESLHGEQIAVTTLYMAALQDQLFSTSTPTLPQASPKTDEDLLAHFGAETGEEVLREWHAKCPSTASSAPIDAIWPELCAAYEKIRLKTARIRKVLAESGAPLTPQDLGLSDAQWQETVTYAKYIRNRFTCLDLV